MYSSSCGPLLHFMQTLQEIHSINLDFDTMTSMRNIFVNDATKRDMRSVQKFFQRCNGQIYYPEGVLEASKGRPKRLDDGTKFHEIYRDDTYYYKKQRTIVEPKHITKEVIYGSYLTYVCPDAFSGVVAYDVTSNTKFIVNDGFRDAFDYYLLQAPAEIRLKIAVSMINNVKRLHSLGFLHNDIKLENVIVDPITYATKLIDFENTTLIEPFMEDGSLSGTYAYVVPTIYMNMDCMRTKKSVWTDIYALCSALIILLFNDYPERGDPEIPPSDEILYRDFRKRKEYVEKMEIGRLGPIMVDIYTFDTFQLAKKYGTGDNFLNILLNILS